MSQSKYLLTISTILTFLIISCTTAPQKTALPAIDMVRADIVYLASDELGGREIGTNGEKMAGDYIAKRFKEIGLKPMGDDGTYFQKVLINKKQSNPHGVDFAEDKTSAIEGRNIIGLIDVGASETIVLGAHYDHLGLGSEGSLHAGDPAIHNGADDNASGVAAITEVAKILMEKKAHQNVLLIAFTGEEKGLWGSNYFVKNPTVDISSMNLMINLDMVGRLETDRGLIINGVGTSPKLKKGIDKSNSFGLKITTTESGVGPSDHTSFYLQDVPVLHFFTGAHEDYHKPSDDVEKINFEGIARIIGLITNLVYQFDDESLAFTKTKDDQGPSAVDFKVTLGVIPDYIYDGEGMRIDGVREDRPAFNAGLLKGDIVTKIGDAQVKDMMSYMEALALFEKGQTVKVTYIRDGKEFIKDLTF